ncbi:MAG TPA: cadherin-like beta sandwich domain-containing protein [Clostridiaceae bacterium]|nr:cadherin-like beta sandwich domain-containing protein [Clostridiaceae bacterium]
MKKNKIINIFFVITIVVVLLQGFTFASNNTSSNSSSNSAQKSNTSNTTTKTKAKSSNANLSNLGMNPNDFTGFSENKTSYDVTVPNNVTQVEIYATKKDSKASLTGTGIKKLQEGQNTANVIVTAEDGTTKTYTINIKRLSKNEKQDTTENLDAKSSSNSKDLELSNLEIEGVNLEPSFESSTYKYEISIKGEQSNLDIKASTNNTSDKVEIIGNENLQNGQNIITILVTNSKSDEVATYQIYVNKNVIDSNTVDNEFGKTVKELKIKLWIFRALVVIVVLGIIMLLIIKHKKNKKEYDEEDDNTDNKYDKDILPKSLRNLDEDSIKKMIKDYNGNESPKVGVDNVENSKKEGFNDYNNNIIIQENYSKIKNDDELQKKGKRSGNGRKKGKRFK